MKILMTLMGLDIGGAETHVMELSRALTNLGHTVILASGGGAFVPTLEQSGVRHVTVPMNQRDPRLMLRSLNLLKKLIREEQPDLVHAHARIPAFLCGILQKRMHFPFITSAHWVFQVTPLLRKISDWGQRTVAVSEDIKTYLMTQYQVPEDQIHVTINGIDTELFAPRPEPEGLRASLGLGTGPVICLVSRLDESRALAAEKLLEIMPRILEEHPGAQLLLVGGGDREEVLRNQADTLNRTAETTAVVMTGPRTDIPQLLSLSTVFVGVSRAALEAMSAEIPVLLAGNEGYIGPFSPEVLSTAQASNFCCRGHEAVTEEALFQDLNQLLSMPGPQRRSLGAYGRQVVLEQYSVARMTQDYLQAYDRLLHPKKPVHAVISGYYGYNNLGDDAILCAIARQLSHLEHPVRLTVLSRRPKDTASQFGLRAVNRFSPFHVFHALRTCDLLISGGGSLLQDSTSTRSLLYYLSVIRLAQMLHRPVFLYANGIGPLNRPANRRHVCRCLNRCSAVTLRDTDSFRELQSLGAGRNVTVTADPAFTLTADPDGRRYLTDLGISENAKLLGISVRSVPGIERNLEAFAALCSRLSREMHRTIVFVVMQEPGDAEISRQIQARMTAPSYLVKTPGKPEAMLGVLSCMEAIISMRLHTIIFAAKQRVPVVGCVYDPKVSSFLQLLDLPSCGTMEEFQADSAYEITASLLNNLDAKRAELDRRVCQLERQAKLTPQLLAQLIRPDRKGELP